MSVPLTGVEILHSSGTRTVMSYQQPTWQRSYAITARVTRGNNTHTILGDRMENPSELPLTLEVEASTLPGAYVLAYSIVEEAETATAVRFHWGDVIVDGVLGASITPVSATSVRVGLRFHPTSGAAVTPGLTYDATGANASISAQAGSAIVTGVSVTYDGTGTDSSVSAQWGVATIPGVNPTADSTSVTADSTLFTADNA